MKDVSLYEPVSSPITHPLDNFAYKEIFTDSKNSGVWGMKTHPCKEVYFDSINSFIGENHLHIIWNDQQKCKYIGFGFKWGNFKGKNLAPLIDQCAIEFMARLDSGELTKVPMFFSLVDYAGKNCFSKINILDIEGGKIDTSWTKILIPLSTFKYQNKGVNISNIDNLGVVHPDTFWWDHDLGNVRQTPFSQIWSETQDPLMQGFRQHPRPVKGRCAECKFLAICNGNTRVRAYNVTGDFWEEDPGCYLTNEEIGVVDDLPRRVAAQAIEIPVHNL